jgi:HD-like signal output (HDOD) protein
MALIQREHTVDDVVKVVQVDAALTTNLLKVVNSAAMGLNRTISAPAQAVSCVGDKMVLGIAIATCTGPIFEGELVGYGADAGALWGHDLYTAIAARELASRSTAVISPEIAFTAGIVHDVGKALISQFLKDTSRSLDVQISDPEAPDFLAAERGNLGTDHCRVGGMLARRWHLPPSLHEAIGHHHCPADAPEEYRSLAYAIHVADHLAMLADQATGADRLQYPLDLNFTEVLGLTQYEFEPLMDRVEREFAKVVGGMFGKT